MDSLISLLCTKHLLDVENLMERDGGCHFLSMKRIVTEKYKMRENHKKDFEIVTTLPFHNRLKVY